MTKIDKIKVLYNGTTVGTLAYYKGHETAFQYDDDWITNGFSISPISLPLQNKVFVAKLELKKLYRLMCFNVYAHNRDDHSRNFSYLYIPEKKAGYFLQPMTLPIVIPLVVNMPP